MVVWGNRTTIPHSPMIIYPNGMESTGATRPQTPLSPRSLNTSLSYLQQPQKAGPFGATRRAGTQVHAFMPLLNVCWYSWKLTNNTNHKPSPAVHVIPFNYSRRVLWPLPFYITQTTSHHWPFMLFKSNITEGLVTLILHLMPILSGNTIPTHHLMAYVILMYL
jgi:hypothetical protein